MLNRWRELRELEQTRKEMKSQFEAELTSIVPHIFRRTEVFSCIEVIPPKQFWKKEYRILFTIQLSSVQDLERIELMARRFVNDYVAQPGKRNCKVKILLQPAKAKEVEI